MMEINHSFQSLLDNMARDKYGYMEIQGFEGRDPEKRLTIRAYESMNSQESSGYYHLREKDRESVKKVAAKHSIECDELPDIVTATTVQREFEGWMNRIKNKDLEKISHYEKALEFAKELSHGVVRGYWRNEIGDLGDIIYLERNAQSPRGDFSVGRERLTRYLIDRIGYGTSTGQSYTTRRGVHYYIGNDELGDLDSMISTMLGIGMLRKLEVNNVFELTGEAFALLKEPKWHERHAEFLSWVSIAAAFLSIVLMLRELGII